jgi:hypothetical protein
MPRIRKFLSAPAAAALLLTATSLTGVAAADTLIEIDDFDLGRMDVVGFELPQAASIKVEAVGVRPRRSRELAAYAWILDARTREPVWVMERRNTTRVEEDRVLRKAEETLQLAAGRYELYTFASNRWRVSGSWFSGWNDHRNWWSGDSWKSDSREVKRALRDCYVRLTSDALSANDVTQFEPTGEIPGALLLHNQLGDDEFIRTAFKLDKEMSLEIYAVVELPEDWDHPADGGWIVSANSNERGCEMDHANTEHAGGAEKNRMFRDEVRFAAGEYILYFGTDDSHSFEEFNAGPPFDPSAWGVTILPGNDFDAGAFQMIEAPERGEPLLDMTRVRDHDFQEQAFRLKRDADLLVYAVGEYSEQDREFVDYGWIQKAGSSEIVWEMTRRDTQHAGGAEKNRMFSGMVSLPAGDYVAYYVTDDSHSYRRWNSAPPFDRHAWGLAIHPGPGMNSGEFEPIERAELPADPNVLVRIVRVGDDEYLTERFTLDADTRVRIYALGEGDRGYMYDAGYIENVETKDVVWEMTWRNTKHAGGARKNRVFDGELLLQAGTYEVVYESDDSHSFQDWNARRPRDPQAWGITVSLANK